MSIVWYVQPYAGGPGIGRYHRAFHLASAWKSENIETHIFCGANHHLLDEGQEANTMTTLDPCIYHFLGLPEYNGNGPRRLLNMLSFGRALRKYIENAGLSNPDVVIYSSAHLFGVRATHNVARRQGADFIFEVRDLWPAALVDIAGISPRHPIVLYLKYLERFAYKHADATVSLLPLTRKHMTSNGLDSRRWNYIPNGISQAELDVARSVDEPTHIDTGLGELVAWVVHKRAAGFRVLVYAGAFGIPNGVHRLLEGLGASTGAASERLQILLIGQGTELDRLRTAAEGLSCRIHQQVDKTHLMQILKHCDGGFVCVEPKPVFRFGISMNKIFDYMAASLPIVNAVGGGNDPVADAECGWTVSANDREELTRALDAFCTAEQTHLKELGKRGQDWVISNHSYTELGAQYANLFSRFPSTSYTRAVTTQS